MGTVHLLVFGELNGGGPVYGVRVFGTEPTKAANRRDEAQFRHAQSVDKLLEIRLEVLAHKIPADGLRNGSG
jgi:hypothetical protein